MEDAVAHGKVEAGKVEGGKPAASKAGGHASGAAAVKAEDAEAGQQGSAHPIDTRAEARHLAEEAVAELKSGNKEEGRFVLEEARRLDPAAVEEVVHPGKGHSQKEHSKAVKDR